MHLSPRHSIAPLLLATAIALPAEDAAMIGPISVGMGGSRIASVDDNTAAFVNPAMLGFMSRDKGEGQDSLPYDNQNLADKDFGLGIIDLTVTGRVHGQLADYVEQLQDLDIDRLQTLGGANATADDLDQLIKVAALLETFQTNRDFVTADTSVGLLNVRAWHIGLGVRVNGHLATTVEDLDKGNIGISLGSFPDISTAINNIQPDGFNAGAVYTPGSGVFSSEQVEVLAIALTGNTGSNFGNLSSAEQQAIARLDQAAKNGKLTKEDLDQVIGLTGFDGALLTEVLRTAGGATGQLSNNTTAVTGLAMTYAEVPIAFGYAPTDWISFGVAPKLLIGKVGAVKARLTDGIDELKDNFKDALEDAEQTITGSVDAGVTVRWNWIQAALVGRNLTNPTFKAPTVDVLGAKAGDPSSLRFYKAKDVELAPQATFGLAFIPWDRFVIEGDVDLNPVELALNGYEVQRANVGARLDLWFIEPMVGFSRNLAEDDIGDMIHAGVGLDLWAFRINVAGAMALDTVVIDGDEYPREASFGFGIDTEW